MGIYLGNAGHVELARDSLNTPLNSLLDPGDVNVLRRRFSFDFPNGAIITGDSLEIRTEDGSNLELVAGHDYPDGRWYCHADPAGGIRLYDRYEDAINGELEDALVLVAPTTTKRILAKTLDGTNRCIANVISYEITTSRETIDLTSLGEEHRRFYASGLISGQGALTCFWSYKSSLCDPSGFSNQNEYPQYLSQLVIRAQQGASFKGRFYLNTEVPNAYLWYEAECIVTNVAMTFEPTQALRSQIQFITTGPIQLRMGMPPGYLLQESGSLLLQEDGSPIRLEDTSL